MQKMNKHEQKCLINDQKAKQIVFSLLVIAYCQFQRFVLRDWFRRFRFHLVPVTRFLIRTVLFMQTVTFSTPLETPCWNLQFWKVKRLIRAFQDRFISKQLISYKDLIFLRIHPKRIIFLEIESCVSWDEMLWFGIDVGRSKSRKRPKHKNIVL